MTTPLRSAMYDVIFGTDTRAGKLFDLLLITAILLSVLVLMLDSMAEPPLLTKEHLSRLEWFFTGIFTLEYALRVYCSPNRWQYIKSYFGVIDLLSVLPTYLALMLTGASYLLVIRLLRVLRIFRVLKLIAYVTEAQVLVRAIFKSRRKILVFFFVVFIMAVIFGAMMYIVEGPEHGFTSIPRSIYWTIVTITTVGYGDITPKTDLGQVIASLAMLTGYSIIAVPTGILTAELSHEMAQDRNLTVCSNCGKHGHERDANFCYACGSPLNEHPDRG